MPFPEHDWWQAYEADKDANSRIYGLGGDEREAIEDLMAQLEEMET